MSQKEPLNSAVKNHDFNVLVILECRDDLIQLRNGLRTENVERRVVECDSPIGWRTLSEPLFPWSLLLERSGFPLFVSLIIRLIFVRPFSSVLSSGSFVGRAHIGKLGKQIANRTRYAISATTSPFVSILNS